MKPTQPPPATFHPGRNLELFDDTIHDPYQKRAKLSEPSVCGDCGAVYHEGRWQWISAPAHALTTRCAACNRIQENMPAGYVSIEGPFSQSHRDELLNLIRHLESHERSEHPLKRIMKIDEADARLLITTTDIHLARQIGEALQRAYKGNLDFHYNKEEYLLRVLWQR